MVRLLATDFGGDTSPDRAAITFLAGVYDLGKVPPAFAVQNAVLANRMRQHNLLIPSESELHHRSQAHHSVAGHHLLIQWLVAQGWARSAART